MISNFFFKTEDRSNSFTILEGVAQVALVLGIFLALLDFPTLDLTSGTLIGFSIVGNLVFMIEISLHNIKRGCHD